MVDEEGDGMQVTIQRTEPTTGGANRTPRQVIEPVFSENDEVEPDIAMDCSGSEGGAVAPESDKTTWEVQMLAVEEFVGAAEDLDSQAEAEQKDGSDEKGGVYGAFYNHGLVKIGQGDDGGDLNRANFRRKIDPIRVRDEHGNLVALPYGGTRVLPTLNYLDEHYLGEFSKWPDGSPRPVDQRPKRARSMWGDGAMADYEKLGKRVSGGYSDYFRKPYEELWPDEEWFFALLGWGTEHDRTLELLLKLAESRSNLHVYSFSEVDNGREVAEDMAAAILATRVS